MKSHVFYVSASVPWDQLHLQTSPYIPDSTTFPSCALMRDGSSPDWLEEGEPTPILQSQNGHSSLPSSSLSTGNRWAVFLQEHEKQIFTGLVWKRRVSVFLCLVLYVFINIFFTRVISCLSSLSIELVIIVVLLEAVFDSNDYLHHPPIFLICFILNAKGLFSKRRQLILTDTPRLLYIDPVCMILKGEIPWTDTQPVSFIQVRKSHTLGHASFKLF